MKLIVLLGCCSVFTFVWAQLVVSLAVTQLKLMSRYARHPGHDDGLYFMGIAATVVLPPLSVFLGLMPSFIG
jgi:hypothetical protein